MFRVSRETAPKPCLLILVMEVRMEVLTVFGGIALLLIVVASALSNGNDDRTSWRRRGNDSGVDSWSFIDGGSDCSGDMGGCDGGGGDGGGD
jgi:hypothetical protein